MGRPRHADGRQTRQAILAAALALFAEKGYFGTSLRDIATVVGIRESAIYNYFKGKDALFGALITEAQEHKAEHVAALMAQPIGNVRRVLEQLTSFLLTAYCMPQQQQLFRVHLSDGMRLAKDGRIDLIERMTAGAAPFDALMRRLIASGALRPRRPDLLIAEFLGPLLLWRYWHAVRPNGALIGNRKAFVRDHVEQFLQGAATGRVARAAGVGRTARVKRLSHNVRHRRISP
jgi:AcrR family transcriptional regulator